MRNNVSGAQWRKLPTPCWRSSRSWLTKPKQMEMLCMWKNMKRSCNKFIKEIQFPACTRHSTSHVRKKEKKNNINNGHHNSPARDDNCLYKG